MSTAALHDPSARDAAALAARITGRPTPAAAPGRVDLTGDVVRLAGEVQELRMELDRVKRALAMVLADRAEAT